MKLNGSLQTFFTADILTRRSTKETGTLDRTEPLLTLMCFTCGPPAAEVKMSADKSVCCVNDTEEIILSEQRRRIKTRLVK